jgi:hypothetical protein
MSVPLALVPYGQPRSRAGSQTSRSEPGSGARSSPYKRDAGGSNPPAPTKFVQLGGLFETLVGDPGTIAGNHTGKRAQRPWQHPHRPPERAAPTAGTTGTEAADRLKDPRRPASLMHACIVMSLMAGVRPEEAQAIGRGRTSTWTATLPRSRCCADRAGGDTKPPRSRRALLLAPLAMGALREWHADQAAEVGRADSSSRGVAAAAPDCSVRPPGRVMTERLDISEWHLSGGRSINTEELTGKTFLCQLDRSLAEDIELMTEDGDVATARSWKAGRTRSPARF